MAERVGFEPTSPVLPGYPLSRRALSTAQTPLQTCKFNGHHRFQQSAHARSSTHLRSEKNDCKVRMAMSAEPSPDKSAYRKLAHHPHLPNHSWPKKSPGFG